MLGNASLALTKVWDQSTHFVTEIALHIGKDILISSIKGTFAKV